MEVIEDRVGTPDEHSAVPEEVARIQESLCGLHVWLFSKCLDREGVFAVGRFVSRGIELNVTVARCRMRRVDTDRDEGARLARLRDGNPDDAAESLFVLHDVVGRKHDHDRLRVPTR